MQAFKEVLFDCIGQKTKTIAFIICILGFIGSALFGIGYMYEMEELLIGILIWVIGALACWCTSIFIYGFGELIDKTTEIAQNTRNSTEKA